MNLASLCDQHPPEAKAFHDTERWWTWGEVRARAGAAAMLLSRGGIGVGDRVALSWSTSPGFAVAYLGILSLGAVVIPVDVSSPPPERERQLAMIDPALVIDEATLERAPSVRSGPPEDSSGRLEVDDRARSGSTIELDAIAEILSGGGNRRLREGLPPAEDAGWRVGSAASRSAGDVAVMLFTSGTGGMPKLAMLTHGSLLANIRQMLGVPGGMIHAGDVGLLSVPMSHVFGLNVALGLSLATGAPLVCQRRFDVDEAFDLVDRLEVTLLTGPPAMYRALAGASDASGRELVRLRRALSGSAPLPVDLIEEFEGRFGVRLDQGYGLTEASPAVATTITDGPDDQATVRARLHGSVGRPLPGVQLRVTEEGCGDLSQSVLPGDAGEIWLRGANVFAGYWRDEAATSEVLAPGGWLRTGDVGVWDDQGNLYVVDRVKDLVIVSGFNVYPEEVERVAVMHPGVLEAVAFGRPDVTAGEVLALAVVVEAGSGVTERAVVDHCRAHLARYKCPVAVQFVSELPKGATGKALRRLFR